MDWKLFPAGPQSPPQPKEAEIMGPGIKRVRKRYHEVPERINCAEGG